MTGIVYDYKTDLELRTPDSIPIVVSLDAAHSMIALPVEAPVFHVGGDHGVPGRMVRQESRMAMKNGAMQSARGIWRSVKALRGCSVRSCGRRRASSKSGFMNRSGPSGHRSLRLKPSGFRSVKLGIGACGPISKRPSHRKSRWALSATVGFVSPGHRIICSIIAITIRRRACARQGCLSQCGEP